MRSACDKTNYHLKQSVTQALLLLFVCVFVLCFLWGGFAETRLQRRSLHIQKFNKSEREREREREREKRFI